MWAWLCRRTAGAASLAVACALALALDQVIFKALPWAWQSGSGQTSATHCQCHCQGSGSAAARLANQSSKFQHQQTDLPSLNPVILLHNICSKNWGESAGGGCAILITASFKWMSMSLWSQKVTSKLANQNSQRHFFFAAVCEHWRYSATHSQQTPKYNNFVKPFRNLSNNYFVQSPINQFSSTA